MTFNPNLRASSDSCSCSPVWTWTSSLRPMSPARYVSLSIFRYGLPSRFCVSSPSGPSSPRSTSSWMNARFCTCAFATSSSARLSSMNSAWSLPCALYAMRGRLTVTFCSAENRITSGVFVSSSCSVAQLQLEPAALRDGDLVAAVEDEVGDALLARDPAGQLHELLVARACGRSPR